MPIRVRLALLAAAVTFALFAVAGILFARSFEGAQVDSLDQGLRAQADTLARRFRDGDGDLDLSSTDPSAAVATSEIVVQVIDQQGRVLDSTEEAGRRPLITAPVVRDASNGPEFAEVALGPDREPFRVIARRASGARDAPVLVVGSSLEAANAASGRLERGLVVGGAAAVALAGFGGWLVAAAALRPVDRMRRDASEISAHDVSSRLSVPATGDEIASLAETINELLGRLQTALQRQRDLVADAGHELRTPLSVLRTELELAGRADRTRAELRDAVDHATSETERLVRLADSLLFLARTDGRTIETQRRATDMDDLVRRIVAAWAAAAEQRDLAIVHDVEAGLVASIDETLVRRAMDNLVDNAIRVAPAGSTVTVAARQDGTSLTLAVSDEGPGFPPEFIDHAFERFRRADDARSRASGGVGLGLAIVAEIARAHDGVAIAANRASGGATVRIEIPNV